MSPAPKLLLQALLLSTALSLACLGQTSYPPSAPAQTAATGAVVTPEQQRQIQSIGYNAGYHAGALDHQQNQPYNVQTHASYQQANQGFYSGAGISLSTYQMNFRSGYENGYDDGYHGKIASQSPQRMRSYAAATPAANGAGGTSGMGGTSATGNLHVAGKLPQGTVLQLKLNHTLSSSSSQPGNAFSATVTQPINNAQGQIMVPVGSLVEGTVAQVHQAGKFTGQSTLALNFQRLQLPDGHTAALNAKLSRVNNGRSGSLGALGNLTQGTASTNQEGQASQSNTRSTVGDVTAGTAVGTLIGALTGGGKGAGIGAAIGAVAGLGTVMFRKNGTLNLPAGTAISITLNQPVYVQ
jgi:hypothetical protein